MPNPQLFPRFASASIQTALEDTPVVMINGPRQCGKTTLVKAFADERRTYLTLDDETALTAARSDPVAFLRPLDTVIIDEIQRAPELLRAIKRSVDDDRRPGRFLLTGSADVLTLPTVAESLAGRMEIVSLLPLSQAEIERGAARFLEQAFSGNLPTPKRPATGRDLERRMLAGGYPEMLSRKDPARRKAWARDYLNAIVQKDAPEIAALDKLDLLPRLLRALAHHAGQLCNFTQLGGQIGLDDKSTRKYLGVLEHLFLIRRLEPWHNNKLSRLIKTPKIHFLDSGLLASLVGATPEGLAGNRDLLGALLETFAFAEVLKAASVTPVSLSHYRDKDKNEVDLVLESEAGDVVGLEVKAAATVKASDFAGLRRLADAAGKRFRLGVVLHDGDTVVGFGERLLAAPVSCLWN
jgi:predicted AAA+ superfamily ATPase